MARPFHGRKLVIASHNAGKVREIGALLAPFHVDVVAASALDLPEPVEDGDTFIANAQIKALAAARASNLPALADDSGLCVRALGGDPGVYSARWAEPSKDFFRAMEKVETALAATKAATKADDRRAYFACALTLAWPDGHTEDFEGHVQGTLVWPPRGDQGFGYDPAFMPVGFDVTFGEMDPDQKHAMSHRAKAFQKLVVACFTND